MSMRFEGNQHLSSYSGNGLDPGEVLGTTWLYLLSSSDAKSGLWSTSGLVSLCIWVVSSFFTTRCKEGYNKVNT